MFIKFTIDIMTIDGKKWTLMILLKKYKYTYKIKYNKMFCLISGVSRVISDKFWDISLIINSFVT